jgi:hypothetical protein
VARECSEVEPGRYRARFALGTDSAAYAALASLVGGAFDTIGGVSQLHIAIFRHK